MSKLNFLMFIIVIPFYVWGRGVAISNVEIVSIDNNNRTAMIQYTLVRDNPTISSSQPVWIFVKFRLAEESDYFGWKDTDDLHAANDASDVNSNLRNQTVNGNLSGDVGIVTSSGTKQIIWDWGNTGLRPDQSAKIRIFAIEMVHVPSGNVQFRQEPGFTDYTLTGTSQKIDKDYYIMKYPVTAEMYKDFLNCCANRHDPLVTDPLYLYYDSTSYFQQGRMNSMAFERDSVLGHLIISGTVGINAQWDIANSVSIPGDKRARSPMTHVSWYNCYDFATWCGLQMVEEEFYYKVSSENGQSNYYWGNTPPNSDLCNYNNNVGHPTDVIQYEDAVMATDGGNLYGAFEMTGNIWEWTSTTADGYRTVAPMPYDPSKGPISYNNTVLSVIKVGGGRWSMSESLIYVARRYAGSIDSRWAPSGFRLMYK